MKDPRVTGTDRTEVIALLNRALDEGHLTLSEYDSRVIAVGTATYASELVGQLEDLPPEFAWLPIAIVAPPPESRPEARSGRAALVLGLLSLPTSFCLLGGVLGLIAVVLSLRRPRRPGWSPALIGRVFGIVGMVLSIGAVLALIMALDQTGTAP
jgi:Domain of unknown function (DUF1707)